MTAGTSVLSDAGDAVNGDDDANGENAGSEKPDAEAEMELGVEAVPTASGVAGVEADDGGMNDEQHTKSSMNL